MMVWVLSRIVLDEMVVMSTQGPSMERMFKHDFRQSSYMELGKKVAKV